MQGGNGLPASRPGNNQPGRVLLCRISNIQHAVTIDSLHTIFSRYGFIEKIVMFDKNGGFQALVQYSTVQPATAAYEEIDCQEMYAGCNQLRVGFSNLNDITVVRVRRLISR
jgi:polypyrimidine tract-binding protein 2